MGEHLTAEAAGGVVRITLSRPDKLNAVSSPLLRELRAVLEGVAADGSVRAVVITGAGRAFSAGADIAEMTAMAGRSSAASSS